MLRELSTLLAFSLAFMLAASCTACAHHDRVRAHGRTAVPALAGNWEMDLSPAQDGSYVKPLTITLDPAKSPAEAPGTFTGTVYGGSPFDNGVLDASQAPAVFSFTSDMDAQMGGPYFWVGRLNADGTLGGAVRSLNRGFNMHWSARRSMNP